MSWWNPFSWLQRTQQVIDLRPADRARAEQELKRLVEKRDLKRAYENAKRECANLKLEIKRRGYGRSKQQSRNLGYIQVPEDLRLQLGWELEHVPWETACFPLTCTPLFVCRVCGSAWLSSYLAKGCHSTSWPCQEDGCTKRARRPYTACRSCLDRKADERYEKKPKKQWDGEGYIYSETLDRFFYQHELYDYLDGEDGAEEVLPCAELRLFLCRAEKPYTFSFYEFLSDFVGEDDCAEDAFRDACHDREAVALEDQIAEFIENKLRRYFGVVPDYESPVLLGEDGKPA